MKILFTILIMLGGTFSIILLFGLYYLIKIGNELLLQAIKKITKIIKKSIFYTVPTLIVLFILAYVFANIYLALGNL